MIMLKYGGIIDKLEEKKIKTSKGKERWSKRAIESTLTREKSTGDVAFRIQEDRRIVI